MGVSKILREPADKFANSNNTQLERNPSLKLFPAALTLFQQRLNRIAILDDLPNRLIIVIPHRAGFLQLR